MRWEYQGLKTQNMQNTNQQAMYIWCHTHRLNLVVVVNVVLCSIYEVDLFGNVESIKCAICSRLLNYLKSY